MAVSYAQQAYDAAVGPKELVWIGTHNHIELYDQDPYVNASPQNPRPPDELIRGSGFSPT